MAPWLFVGVAAFGGYFGGSFLETLLADVMVLAAFGGTAFFRGGFGLHLPFDQARLKEATWNIKSMQALSAQCFCLHLGRFVVICFWLFYCIVRTFEVQFIPCIGQALGSGSAWL